MAVSELLQIPNLFSLSRVVLAPIIGYLLWRDGNGATAAALVLMAVAGITDGLDGYLARRLGRVTRLGVALDPIADKLFAGMLVIALILFRDFPLWLATAILGRDLLILALGAVLMRGRDLSLPSNLTGKYAFSAIVVLLVSYVLRFPFGITMMTWITVTLLAASLVSYGAVFRRLSRGDQRGQWFEDKTLYRGLRTATTCLLSLLWLWQLYRLL